MTSEQKVLIAEYIKKVTRVYVALEDLKKCMNTRAFKALVAIANSDSCMDDDLVEAMGIVHGDIETFIGDLPNAVCN